MALEKITTVTGQGVFVPGDDIDTDRIIPARFMKCVTFDGLGQYLFYDVRKTEDGRDKPHPLNDPRHSGATILLSGRNFGCGSSREHAPQALYRWGIRGVVAESFAEIFFGNCATLGIPCFSAAPDVIADIANAVENAPQAPITLDVANLQIRVGERAYPAEMRASAQSSLVAGQWDPIAELLENIPQVDARAAALPYLRAA